MHTHDLGSFGHSHDFRDGGATKRERALATVTVLTLVTMAVELAAGWWSGSLALTADGWHMGTHALALGGAVLAYRLSLRAAGRGGYAFGGWKIEVLAAYTSALVLLAVALWLVLESLQALRTPRSVAYGEAAWVAAIGLAVNLASAWLLARGARPQGARAQGAQEHGHAHAHAHAHPGRPPHARPHHDHNFGAAYLHVIADALTSVLALAALAGGAWFGWRWLDPAVALVGAAVIGQWALGSLRGSARVLVDATEDPQLARRIRERVECDGDARVSDLHAWQVGTRAWCAVVSVVADRPLPALDYRTRLDAIEELRHVTVEVHRCPGPASPA
jgi:cation diffusion facilitator family transporter